MAEQIRRFWNVTHVVHVHYDFLIASTFAKTSEMIFHDVSSMFCSSCCNSKYLVRDKYFGAQVCTAGWHTLALRCFLLFYGLFFSRGGIETYIYTNTSQQMFDFNYTNIVCFCLPLQHLHIFFVPTILCSSSQAPSTPVLVLRWECEEETMRWFQHLEAATHQSRSARDVLREVPLLSVLVIEINSR